MHHVHHVLASLVRTAPTHGVYVVAREDFACPPRLTRVALVVLTHHAVLHGGMVHNRLSCVIRVVQRLRCWVRACTEVRECCDRTTQQCCGQNKPCSDAACQF